MKEIKQLPQEDQKTVSNIRNNLETNNIDSIKTTVNGIKNRKKGGIEI